MVDDDFRDWPRVSKALVEKLKQQFPERCIRENESFDKAHRYAGKIEIIQILELVHKAQSEKS